MAFWRRKQKTAPEAAPETTEESVHIPEPVEGNVPADLPGLTDGVVSTGAELTEGAQIPAADALSEERPKGLFARFRQGLKKTTQVLNTDVRDLFKKEGQLLDDEFVDRLYQILVKTDMGAKPALEIRNQIEAEFRGRVVHMGDVLGAVRAKLYELTAQPREPIQFAESGPTVILIVGVNGSGKTTSIAKLAHRFRADGKSVVLGAGDTFRAAAVKQLEIWAERVGAEIVTGPQGTDPASVAHRAVALSLEQKADVCILDTAGRLQTQTNLMEELAKIHRVIAKQIPEAPHEVLLVLDATAGQNGVSQAKGFSDAAECTGIILAKLDGSAKGGVVIPIRQHFELPVKFVGLGEKHVDLAPFDATQFVDALFEGLDAASAKL